MKKCTNESMQEAYLGGGSHQFLQQSETVTAKNNFQFHKYFSPISVTQSNENFLEKINEKQKVKSREQFRRLAGYGDGSRGSSGGGYNVYAQANQIKKDLTPQQGSPMFNKTLNNRLKSKNRHFIKSYNSIAGTVSKTNNQNQKMRQSLARNDRSLDFYNNYIPNWQLLINKQKDVFQQQ